MTEATRRLTIRVRDDRGRAFVEAWHRGLAPGAGADEVVSFEDFSSLLSTLTPRRLELLRIVSTEGRISMRRLSRLTERDYSNIRADVKALERVGLLARAAHGVYLPFSKVVTEMDFAA